MYATNRNKDSIYQPIPAASCISGQSQYSIRIGIKNGEIPHIKSGRLYLVNMPKYLEMLNVKSIESMKTE